MGYIVSRSRVFLGLLLQLSFAMMMIDSTFEGSRYIRTLRTRSVRWRQCPGTNAFWVRR